MMSYSQKIKSDITSNTADSKHLQRSSFLQNLQIRPVGNSMSTEELKDKAKSILSQKTSAQIDALGVLNRYIVPQGEKNITNYCKDLIKETIKDKEISNLVVASEISDYQTPGLAPLLVNEIGNNYANVFNLQGTACSSLPKTLQLCENLKGDTLVLINGITSPIYQKTLVDLINKNEIIESGSKDWVALMFSFLFGDGITSFIHSNEYHSSDDYQINPLGQVTNIHPNDHLAAYVDNQLYPHASKNILELALQYTDHLMKKLGMNDLSGYDKVILHTGSQKIINAFKEKYSLEETQIQSSRYVLEKYGNLTGCSLPFALKHAGKFDKALLIGISMGASVDMAELFSTN